MPRAARGETRVVGPVESRLKGYGDVEGWIFGIWGEASDSVHVLINRIVESRLKIVGQQQAGGGG